MPRGTDNAGALQAEATCPFSCSASMLALGQACTLRIMPSGLHSIKVFVSPARTATWQACMHCACMMSTITLLTDQADLAYKS